MNSEQAVDVVVVGGGVMGAATAARVAREGRRTLLLERLRLGHNRGSSHGDGRIIRYSYPQAVYAAMADRAYHGWRELSEVTGQTVVETTGGLDLAPGDSAALTMLESSLASVDAPFERLGNAALHKRFPALRPPDGVEALYQPSGGVVRADRAVASFWHAAEAAGAAMISEAQVTGIDIDGRDDVVVTLEDGRRWRAERLILAVGGWSGGMLAGLDLNLPLRVTQERLVYLPPRAGAPSHALEALPTIIDYHDSVNHFYALPQVDIPGVKVGWHRSGPVVAPDDERVETPDLLEGIVTWAARNLPYFDPRPISDLTCLYTNTPDFDFILDHHPRHPQIVIGAGFSGHGFKFAPVIGDMLAALALDRPDPVPRDAFRVDRFE